MTTPVTLLKDIGESHERMVELSSELDWDGLVGEWRSSYPKILELKKTPLNRLTGAERAEASRLIAKLIALEEQVSGRISPWMDQVRPLLETFRKYPIKPGTIEGS